MTVVQGSFSRRMAREYFEKHADQWGVARDTLVLTEHRFYVHVASWLQQRNIQSEFMGTLYGCYNVWSIPRSQDRLLFRLQFPL